MQYLINESNKYYQPYKYDQMIRFKPKTKCLVINCYDGQLLVSIDEKVFILKELSRNKRFSEEFDVIPDDIKEKLYSPNVTSMETCFI